MAMSNTFHSSSKAHAISGGGKLASVQKHNERGYFSFEYNPSLIHSLIGDVHTIVEDVTNYINEKFQSAIDDFNSKKTRNDRKINKTPFEYFCDNKKLDIANEAILQLGDKEFWSATRIEEPIVRNGKNILLKDYPPEVKKVMDEIFMLQAEAYENIYKTHKDEILKRIKQDYEYSKDVMKDFDAEELKAFEKIAPLKVKERKKKIEEFPEDKKERFERFLKASSTIDLVEDKRIISRIENEEMTIKLLNLVAHYDEFSPHAHGVSVCSIKGYKTGLNERVAKSVVLNKWTLSVIQDRLHEIAEQEMAKHPEIFTEPLAEKKEGRNYDYTTDGYKRFQMDELEKQLAFQQRLVTAEEERAAKAHSEAEQTIKECAEEVAKAREAMKTSLANKEQYDSEVKRLKSEESPVAQFHRAISRFIERIMNAKTRNEIIGAARELFQPFFSLYEALCNISGYENKHNLPEEEREAPSLIADIENVLASASERSEATKSTPHKTEKEQEF